MLDLNQILNNMDIDELLDNHSDELITRFRYSPMGVLFPSTAEISLSVSEARIRATVNAIICAWRPLQGWEPGIWVRVDEGEVHFAFSRIVYPNVAFCYTKAHVLVKDYDQAEEVAQLALFKAYRHFLVNPLEQLLRLQQAQAQPWLYKIIVNTARNQQVLQRRLVHLDPQEIEALIGPNAYEGPELALVHIEESRELDHLLGYLRPSYRDIITRLVLREESYEEVADKRGCDIRLLRTTFHRATQALGKLVKDEGIKEGELRRWFLSYGFEIDDDIEQIP